MSKKTVCEDKEEKEARRKQKQQERLQKHIVQCPHCGRDVLDHMTECPDCGGALTPRGYRPMSEKKQKIIRCISYGIGIAVAIAIVVIVFVMK